MRSSSSSALIACAALLACGCSLDSGGLGDLFESADGGPGSGVDGTVGGTAEGSVNGADGSGDDDAASANGDSSNGDSSNGGGLDAGSDTCASNVEICNNGIDDNCNGLIDCADTECQPAWQCTNQSIPAGWTIVEYANSATPVAACGTGYASAPNVYEGPFPGAMCTCSCNVQTSGSCTTGGFSTLLQCTGTAIPGATTGCQSITPNYTLPPTPKQQITPAPYTAGSCHADGGVTTPSVPENGHVCAETTAPGAGCANSGACVPAAQTGYSLCISNGPDGGTVTCPSGFTTATHDVGTAITDTRGCTQCTCTGPTATCSAHVTLFTDSQCGDGGLAEVQANGQCDNVNVAPGDPMNPSFAAYEYSANIVGEACGSGTSSPNGGVALTGQSTICCQ